MPTAPVDPFVITLDFRPFRDAIRRFTSHLAPLVRAAAFRRAGVTDTGPMPVQHLQAVTTLQKAVQDSKGVLRASVRQGRQEAGQAFDAAFTDLRHRWGLS